MKRDYCNYEEDSVVSFGEFFTLLNPALAYFKLRTNFGSRWYTGKKTINEAQWSNNMESLKSVLLHMNNLFKRLQDDLRTVFQCHHSLIDSLRTRIARIIKFTKSVVARQENWITSKELIYYLFSLYMRTIIALVIWKWCGIDSMRVCNLERSFAGNRRLMSRWQRVQWGFRQANIERSNSWPSKRFFDLKLVELYIYERTTV